MNDRHSMRRQRSRSLPRRSQKYLLDALERRMLLSGIAVSVPGTMTTFQGGELAVPILVAQLTDGTGDTGLSSANICINYTSSDFTIADVKQGTAGQEASSLLSVTTSGTPGFLKVSIAEQPLAIASVVGSGSGPVTVTTKSSIPAAYGGSPFLGVQLTGIANFAAANGVWNISVTGSFTFTLNNSSSLIGTATANTGTYGAIMQGGVAGTSGGSNNPSIAVVDFLAKTNAATGSTSISLVASNSAGTASLTAADGVGYGGTLVSGSVNILASGSAPKLGSFTAVPPLSTLTGVNNDPGIGVMLQLPDGDIMANGGNDGESNQWFLLTPDSSGSYSNGTWSALASSNIGRNSFGSAVLNNGQVMILGGERTNINAAIASVVGSHTAPITVTMVNPLPTDLTSGNVSLSNVKGFSGINVNESFNITVTGPKTFTLNGTTGDLGSATPNTGTLTVSETNTGEIFTPPTSAGGAGTWQNITSFPLEEFGDGNLELMSDGTVLAGYFGAYGDPDQGQTYRYNEALDPLVTPSAPKGSNPWTLDATLPAGDSNAEVTWNKLPDGSIVSANIGGNSDESPQTATRLVFGATQAQDQWVSAGTIPVPMGATGGDDEIQEMGPAVLLPNGTLFQIGSSGNTALYTPPALANNSTGTWVAGPVIPGGYAPTDAPGAMMSNGDVLFAAAPYLQQGAGDGGYNNSTELFEYNPTTNTIRQVPPDNGSGSAIADLTSKLASNYCFEMRMLDLPTGQVMFSDGSGNTYVYTPSGSPNGVATPLAAWQPTIANITAGTGQYASDFQLTGTQLNGISEGASYGDDSQMATNYPLVQLTSSSGAVSYATTFMWSSAGVATGASQETTLFSLPIGDAPGAYLVSVVANGIASNSALVVFMGGASSASVVTDPNNSAEVDVDLAGKSALPFTLPATTTQVIVSGANDNQSITMNDNLGSRTITINTGDTSAGDTEAVNIQQTGTGGTVIFGGAGNDTFDLGGTVQNLSAIPGDVLILAGTGSTNAIVDDTYNGSTSTYTVLDGAVERAGFGGVFIEGNYQTLSLIAGYAPENVNVIETPAGSNLNLNAGGGDDTVVIGRAGTGLADIMGPVDVSNTPYYTQLTLNDVGDTTAHPNVIMNNGSVVGLAPAVINYTTATNDVNALTIDGNDTNDGYFIFGGSTLTPVTLNDGAGTNQVDFVEPSLGGTYTINGRDGTTDVYVADGGSTAQTYTVTSAGLTASGYTLNVSSVGLLTLNASSGINNVVDIQSLPCVFDSYGSGGSVMYLVSNNHIMPNLVDGMLLEGGAFGGTIIYDDSQGIDANEPVIASSSITAGGGVCGYLDVSSITLDTGFDEGIPVNINSTFPGTPVTINPGPGSTTIDATQTSPTGPVIIGPGGGTTEVHVSINGAAANVIFQATQQIDELTIGNGGIATISGSGPVVLTASSLSLSGNGKLDITANTFKIDYPAGQDPVNTIRGYLKTAYAGGLWSGTGLTSSTIQAQVAGAISHPGTGIYAIGYLDGAADVGQSLVTGNQLVFQPTIVGDTDFNGDTNFLDLGRVAQNLGAINSDWFHGDFNYDGSVNFLDVGLLAQNLNKTTINTPVSANVPTAKVAAVITPKPAIATNLYVAGDNTVAGVWTAPAPATGVLFADGKSANVLD